MVGGRQNTVVGSSYNTLLSRRNGTISRGSYDLILGGLNNSVRGNCVIAFGSGVIMEEEDRRMYLFTDSVGGLGS